VRFIGSVNPLAGMHLQPLKDFKITVRGHHGFQPRVRLAVLPPNCSSSLILRMVSSATFQRITDVRGLCQAPDRTFAPIRAR
jgi:hypothetical protein